ncbi:MAG TPA: nicotinate phosphoribosyltransferase [Clostridiales bacterium]|nr:MAG: nicotinate phosphoribosyltransferase [Clostridiales bacterium GWD2_32_59]HAN10563.1 nicotinate phosphoribosyltransferase [Clostridiales bacterium]
MKFNMEDGRNLTLLTDLYQLTMMQVYNDDEEEKIACFDMFYRKNPDKAGFAVFAGLEKIIKYIKGIKFEQDDIEYLRNLKLFDDKFLDYLKDFKFDCDIWSMPEGTVVFPGEPLLVARGPLKQVQFIETAVLNIINHQSRIATKAERIVRAADKDPVVDFGLRRAHGDTAGLDGARASYIAGMAGTSNVLAGKMFGIPVTGTMAHSFIMEAGNEYEAFCKYANKYPDKTTLLVDTYDTLNSGVPNAIRVAKEIIEPTGHKLKAIRLDSGDLSYLSKEARKMLDAEGLDYVKIVASNSLDEYLIKDLKLQGNEINMWGVGERNITAKSDPVFGGVYKLSEVEYEDGRVEPKIKISENVEKMTNPGFKTVSRLYDNQTGKAIADVISLRSEEIDFAAPYVLKHERDRWKTKEVENYIAKELLTPIFEKGQLVYNIPTLQETREFCKAQVETLWDEVKRFENPHEYIVDLSDGLRELKYELIEDMEK